MDHQTKHRLPRDCPACGEYVHLTCEPQAGGAEPSGDGWAWPHPGPASGWGDRIWHGDCLRQVRPWAV